MSRGEGGPDETIAVVLSGGVALGAYQGGAYAALHDAGIRPDWLAGASIGAVNAAIIAGNPPETRLERLKQFWDAAAIDQALGAPWGGLHGTWRHALNWAGAMRTRAFGSPALFRPRLAPGLGGSGSAGLYDLGPLRASLGRFVDFGRLNGGDMRLSVVAVDLTTGEEVVFDTRLGQRIEPDHLLASCGFVPEFAPTEIAGRLLGDGGLTANAPIEVVLLDAQARRGALLCFVLDLYARESARPSSLEATMARGRDLLLANQVHASLAAAQREDLLRAAIARIGTELPLEARNAPEIATLLLEGDRGSTAVLHLGYSAPSNAAGPEKHFDFSHASLTDRWRAGRLDAEEALRVRAGLPLPAARPGLSIHQIRRSAA